jgi:hypothetical protein
MVPGGGDANDPCVNVSATAPESVDVEVAPKLGLKVLLFSPTAR